MANDRVLDKLDTLLGNRNDNGMYGVTAKDDDQIFDRMFEFIISLDPEQLSEGQAETIMNIIEDVEMEFDGVDEDGIEEVDEDEDDLDEAPKRVKRNRSAARKRAKSYRRNKSTRKRAAKKYRKSSRGKQMAKKSKRMAKRGKTASGKRKRTFR